MTTKKIILTSAVAMFVAIPSMAEPSNTGTFPTDGRMQADYTYTNAATSDNMAGVYENSVYANAQYTTNDYTVNAGYYLPADSENPNTTCPAGSFCSGLQSPVQYNATTAQGITACPAGYTNSAEGASANTECYRTCAIANNGTTFTNIAHATAVSGNDYYNTTATDTCEATACENGWHVKAGVDLATTIGQTAGKNSAYVGYVGYNGSFSEQNYDGQGEKGESYYGFSSSNYYNRWAVDYGSGKGLVTGQARCSTTPGTITGSGANTVFPIETSLTDETGQEGAGYCYCTVDGYKDTNGTMQSLFAPWVYVYGSGGADSCANDCAHFCAYYMQPDSARELAARAALFGAVQSPASCEANTITINWSDAAQADIDANNAGSVTYGGNINTPVKAATKKGKTFRGWIFSTNAPARE